MIHIPSIRVLVVDDEPYLCDLSKEFLERSEDIEVEIAYSVSKARTILGQSHFDGIVSDYQMPGEDGIQFLKSLRGKGDEIPFILFTGKGREEVVIEALNSGADSYLQKGGKPESQYVELEHRIRAVVRQRRGAQALRESEERYRKVFFSNHDSICITRLSDGMFVSANHGFTEMSGYDEEEIIGKTSLEINLWKDPEDRRKIVEALRTKGEVRDYEARFATKLGEMDGSMSASVIELNGEAHILNVTRDITERKANEATLKDNEERYRQLFEMESDALVLVDKRDGQLLEVNHAAERLYGYDRSELLQMKSTDLSAQVEETARAMKESATSVPLRFHRKKDGSIFPVEITATNYDWRGIPVLICAIRDIAERQRSERALRESEVRFEQLAEHARTVTWEIDADGLFTYVSSVSKVAWGYRPDELVGKKHFFDLIPEAYRRSVKAMTSEAFKRKEQFTDLEGHIQTKDGEVRTVSTNGIPLLNADGTLRGYQGSETDITERKRDELAIRQKNSELQRANEELAAKEGKIREGEVRYRSLFENMLNGFAYCRLLFDSEGLPVDFIYLKVNDAFESITGLRNVEGRNVTDVIPGIRESSPELFEIYSRVAMTGKPETFEIDLKSMNIWLRISVFRAEALSFVAVFENITERKQTEEKLLQISDRLLIAARAGGVGIWDFDVVRNRLTWDGQMFKLYGIQEGQFGGAYDAWKAGLLPEDRQRAELETQMALRGEKEYDTEFRVLWPDGAIRHIRALALVQRDASGRALRMVGTNWDITAGKQMEEALHESNRRLNLLSNVTRHDLVNQLLVLQRQLALLKRERLRSPSSEPLQRAEAAAERISATIEFTKEYEDIGIKAPIWVSPGCQMVDVFASLHPVGVTLLDEICDIEIFADPLSVKVPYNLLDNSMRHGERVTHIKLSTQQRGDAMLIVYEDDGVGISEEDKKRLFERGFGKNTGFGLFLAREILAITGITITENGKAGVGVRFEIMVPSGAWRLPSPR